MNFQQIDIFMEMVALKSFSAVADKMYISQSSVSKQIKGLEKEWGGALFVRHSKTVELSELGQRLLPSFQRLSEQYAGMLGLRNDYLNQKRSVIRLDVLPVMAQYGISKMLDSFCQVNGTVGVRITEMESSELHKRMEAHACDFVLTRVDDIDYAHWNAVLLSEDHMVCVLRNDHPFAVKESVFLLDLKNQPMILLANSTGIYDRIVSPCLRMGFMPNIVHTASHIETLISLIQNEQGLSVLFDRTIRFFNTPDLILKPILPRISSWLCLAWRKDLPMRPEYQAFIAYFRQQTGQ